jgi:uncharacterized membrane protein YgcG
MSQVLYSERSWNPLARTVELTEDGLRVGGWTMPLSELNLGAMAEAFQRGCWLGGGGTERPLQLLAAGAGVVPVTTVTGTARPVRVRQAAQFARELGTMAVRQCGGPQQVTALAARAQAEGVPLWIARRHTPGPAGPVTVALDRRLGRVDVWGPGAPVVRIRAPHGFQPDAADPSKGVRLTIGDVPAQLSFKKKRRKSKSSVEVRLPDRHWVLRRESAFTSWLLCGERPVALLTCPPRRPVPTPGTLLRPLAEVPYESTDPLDAVMAHVFAVAFGLGDATGIARLRPERRPAMAGGEPFATDATWDRPWFSNLGSGGHDNEPGGGDGWGWDGDGGDSGGSDGGGGDGGGGGGGD